MTERRRELPPKVADATLARLHIEAVEMMMGWRK